MSQYLGTKVLLFNASVDSCSTSNKTPLTLASYHNTPTDLSNLWSSLRLWSYRRHVVALTQPAVALILGLTSPFSLHCDLTLLGPLCRNQTGFSASFPSRISLQPSSYSDRPLALLWSRRTEIARPCFRSFLNRNLAAFNKEAWC